MAGIGRLARGILLVGAAGIAAVALVLVALLIEHSVGVTLPSPTGPLPVGRSIREWQIDPRRDFLVWAWYPAATAGPAADYLPPEVRSAIARSRGPIISNLLTRDLAKVHGHSSGDAPLSSREPSYPVLIMRSGGSGGVANYATLAEDLASHGYVVVGFDVPRRTNLVAFSDGRVIRAAPENNPETGVGEERMRRVERLLAEWTTDIGLVLDELNKRNASEFGGRLDLTRIGVFGHSFGGAQAAEFCHRDPRCKAAVDIDGIPFGSVTREGIDRPIMFLLSDHAREQDPESARIIGTIRSIYESAPPRARAIVVIRGSHHFTFTDDGAILKSHLLRGILRLFGRLHIDGRRQLEITAYCLRTFFDGNIKGAKISPKDYPEMEILN